MCTALIGYTGFVGSTLDAQAAFDDRYNSTNIEEIRGREYELIVCAGAPAAKWKANQEAEADLANLQRLMSALRTARAERFLLISTVDVYRAPQQVDEDTPLDLSQAEPYGKHRYYLEEFVRQSFNRVSIVRLPGLFGRGLKKNFIYDLLHNNCLHMTHCESRFQFYNMENLWHDLQVVLQHSLPLVNFATEPVRAKDVAWRCFGLVFETVTERPPVYYDMHSKFAHLFGSSGKYLYWADQTFEQIRQFALAQGGAMVA